MIWKLIESFRELFKVRFCFFIVIYLPVTLDFNFESYIKLTLILVSAFLSLWVQKFYLIYLSVNLDPNQVIFDSVDFSSSYLSKNIKILNLSAQFILRFDQISKIPQKYLNSLWI